jgi:hypothetical protein
MKNFDPFLLNFCILLELKTKEKQNGQGLLSPSVPGPAGGNKNSFFLYPMTLLYHIRWKFWHPGYLEIVSDEI